MKPNHGNAYSQQKRAHQEALAQELATALNDVKGLHFYLSMARKHPEIVLREKLADVLSTPDRKILTSRGAYFNYLMQKYEREQKPQCKQSYAYDEDEDLECYRP